jgi:hypothetical protein
MNSTIVYLRERAAGNVTRLAASWARANKAWLECNTQPQEDALHQAQRDIRAKLEAAAYQLATYADEDADDPADAPIGYVPSTPVAAEALEQAVAELDRQKRDGWHLIQITEVEIIDGVRVERDAQYLETGS